MTELKKPINWPHIPCDGETSGVLNWPTLYRDLARMREVAWRNRCREYEADPDSFHAAWWWLQQHPIFWYFGREDRHESTLCSERGVDEGLEFRPVRVNPSTLRVSKKSSKNTLLQIWVEVFPSSLGPDSKNSIRLHDVECDTGAGTYEEAVIEVARMIYERHGHDRVKLVEIWESA